MEEERAHGRCCWGHGWRRTPGRRYSLPEVSLWGTAANGQPTLGQGHPGETVAMGEQCWSSDTPKRLWLWVTLQWGHWRGPVAVVTHTRVGTTLRDCSPWATHSVAGTAPMYGSLQISLQDKMPEQGHPGRNGGSWRIPGQSREKQGAVEEKSKKQVLAERNLYTLTQPSVLPVTCPKKSVGTYCSTQWQGRWRLGRKEERCWTEVYPGEGEEKCFPKCLFNCLSSHLFSMSESVTNGLY